MASLSLARAAGTGTLLIERVAAQGSASHPWRGADGLLSGPDAARNLADSVHFLAMLHGRHPGIVDHAAGRSPCGEARSWLAGAAEAMAGERLYLTRLAVAAGPVPGTPGGGGAEAAVQGQRSALETLATSERGGCALGAALAFALDWAPVRAVLDAAAARFGLEPPPFRLGAAEALAAVADSAGSAGRSIERALLFGAEQVALQHHGLWDLLEARASARC